MKQGMYIVVSENEIVKAEMERPGFDYQFPPDGPSDSMLASAEDDYQDEISKWEDHCLSLPRIPIKGKHNWKVWQEVPESEVRFKYQVETISNDIDVWRTCTVDEYNRTASRFRRIVAIPIEQTKSEQGEKNVREDIAKILRDNIHFSGQAGDYIIHGAIDKIIEYFKDHQR